MDEEQVQSVNSRHRDDSVGSLSGIADVSAVYTPEQIAAMPPKELARKLPEVMRSLREQKK